jgi:Family of unknown function (DUF5335)
VQHTTEIPREGWDRFFARFSEEHETQTVAVEVMGLEIGAQVEGRSLLLGGISPADHDNESLALTFDSLDGEHLTHMVNKPTHVWVQRAPDHTEEALEIEAADGTRTLVRFPSNERSSQSDDLKGVERFPRKSDDEV